MKFLYENNNKRIIILDDYTLTKSGVPKSIISISQSSIDKDFGQILLCTLPNGMKRGTKHVLATYIIIIILMSQQDAGSNDAQNEKNNAKLKGNQPKGYFYCGLASYNYTVLRTAVILYL
jgi:hypothetical protein